MTSLLLTFLQINILLALSYGLYQFAYAKGKHFRFNRGYLIVSILLSFLLPMLSIEFSFLGTDASVIIEGITNTDRPGVATGIGRATPVPEGLVSLEIINPESKVWILLGSTYLLVCLYFFIRFGKQLWSVFLLLKRSSIKAKEDYYLVNSQQAITPFSFFKYIVLGTQKYDEKQLDMILAHERVHVRQWHNIDLLLGEILVLTCWLNPVVWKMRKAIRQNLEFLADEGVLAQGKHPKLYQYTLLAQHMNTSYPFAVANHFNQSLLKKRIAMMNKKKSPKLLAWKQLLIIPILGLMCFLAQPLLGQEGKATGIGQFTKEDMKSDKYLKDAPLMKGEKLFGIVRANLSMEALRAMQIEFKRRGIELGFSNIDFTSDGEIARVKLSLTQWNQSEQHVELYNDGKAIEETATAYMLHNKKDKSAQVGLCKCEPNSLETGLDDLSLLNKVTGVLIRAEDGTNYLKGEISTIGFGSGHVKIGKGSN